MNKSEPTCKKCRNLKIRYIKWSYLLIIFIVKRVLEIKFSLKKFVYPILTEALENVFVCNKIGI